MCEGKKRGATCVPGFRAIMAMFRRFQAARDSAPPGSGASGRISQRLSEIYFTAISNCYGAGASVGLEPVIFCFAENDLDEKNNPLNIGIFQRVIFSIFLDPGKKNIFGQTLVMTNTGRD